MKIVKTCCTICSIYCGIDAYVDNGKIVKILPMQEHPVNYPCVKAYGIPEWVHSSERLLNPLVKVNGKLKETTWDEALGFAADKLTKFKQEFGAKSFVLHTGQPAIRTSGAALAGRFTSLYGSRNITSGGSFCFFPRPLAFSLTCGGFMVASRTPQTRSMVVWGENPQEAYPPKADSIYTAKGRGTRLIVIDPRDIPLAKVADISAQIRPGTDCAMALGILNIIISEELYDKAFVRDWTVGFDKLAEHVKQYTPEKVEAITHISAKKVVDIARMIGSNAPTSIIPGVSTDHSTNGVQSLRAMAIISAITGSIDVPGGSVFVPPLPIKKLVLDDRFENHIPVGGNYPFFTKYSQGEQSASELTDQILTEKPYPVKSLVAHAVNIVVNWPNANKVKQALKKLGFFMVVDLFMTETAQMADVVLPAVTFMEKEELLYSYASHRPSTLMVKSNKAIEPIGNAMPDGKIWSELAKKMGYGEFFPWKNDREYIEEILKPTSITYAQLEQNPGGFCYAPEVFRKYEKNGFNTPSKKVELYSQQMKDKGYDPMPVYMEPPETQISRPDLAKDYPLTLITGPRTVNYFHSRFRNVPRLRKLMPEPLLSINPETAKKYQISKGDRVKLETVRGSVQLKANLTSEVPPGVISVPHGWSFEANVNLLTNDAERDPISAFPGWRPLLCRVSKA